MVTCKNCLYNDVCDNKLLTLSVIEYGDCSRFKDKSRYIELPCKVGITLYFLYNRPFADKPDMTPRIYETDEWYFDVGEKGISICPRVVHGYNHEYFYELGKTVFLSRAEAENALNKRENVK